MSPAKNGPVQMIRTESAAQVERWKAAAKRDKRTLSDWIRLTLDAAAAVELFDRGYVTGAEVDITAAATAAGTSARRHEQSHAEKMAELTADTYAVSLGPRGAQLLEDLRDYANELASQLEAERAKRLPTHYESNGEAGDGQTVCDICGGETDEGHEPSECAQVVALNIDHGWHVAGVATDEAEALREKLKSAEEKLRAATAVVSEVLDYLDPHTECHLCDPHHPDDGGDWQHAEDCPLVTNGFVTVDGKRTDAINPDGSTDGAGEGVG